MVTKDYLVPFGNRRLPNAVRSDTSSALKTSNVPTQSFVRSKKCLRNLEQLFNRPGDEDAVKDVRGSQMSVGVYQISANSPIFTTNELKTGEVCVEE